MNPTERRFDPGLIYVLLPSILYLIAAPDWCFDSSQAGLLDAYNYIGYFQHYFEHVPMFDGYYKASRLPWILPGAVLFPTLGPVLATYVLFTACAMIGQLCLYLTIKHTLDNRRVALVATLIFATYPYMHGSGGWHYHETIVPMYFFTTTCLLTFGVKSARPKWWLLGAGVALGCVIHTHPYLAVFTPGLILHAIVVDRVAGQRSGVGRLLWCALLVILGLLGVTLAMCVINFVTGGQFLFFMPQVHYMIWLSQPGANHWHRAVSEWAPGALYLAIPAGLLVACVIAWVGRAVLRRGDLRGNVLVATLHLPFVFGVGMMTYSQLVAKQTLLDSTYQSINLICVWAPALGGILYLAREGLAKWGIHSLGLLSLLLLWVPQALLPAATRFETFAAFRGLLGIESGAALMPTHLALVVVGLLATLVCYRFRFGFCIAVGFISFGMNFSTVHWTWSIHERQVVSTRDYFATVLDCDAFVSELDPTHRAIKYWFEPDGKLQVGDKTVQTAPMFNSLVATRLWLGNLLGGSPPPKVEQVDNKMLRDVPMVGVLAAPDRIEALGAVMQERLRQLGKVFSVACEGKVFRAGDVAFALTVLKMEKAQERFQPLHALEFATKDLHPKLSAVKYGDDSGPRILKNAGGLLFQPLDPRDHLTTAYQPLATVEGATDMRLRLRLPQAWQPFRFLVQDKKFATIVEIDLAAVAPDEEGWVEATGSIPEGASEFRFCIMSKDGSSGSVPSAAQVELGKIVWVYPPGVRGR